ncbi:3-isopropylmalate dehydratase small subunit [Hymenobacter rubripertinctus]|uniref:3-isopropylmalate dehydratase small subunit n=1 Tax=Hymenobacter rubripertinctus TaxID=2029981 RepID=A0A418R049_9BACT|nr:3-isopropylmalate dehydratase small subunit [Hymenobacter rubripertinctus]RIY10792.1 3-isopropylmalate dehydratase small subunit [Hymenobacter rubripertinctus]
MEKFQTLRSGVVPLPIENVDTDQIIPARFLKATTREGFGQNLFADWRYAPGGQPKADFVLNDPRYQGHQILLAGQNFGCGSSREHAAWALYDAGFRVVISSYFADIFRGNALNTGLLPVQVTEPELQALFAAVQADSDLALTVDLRAQTLRVPGRAEPIRFGLDAYKKECLLSGYDDIDFLLSQESAITTFEQHRPWIF